MPAATPAATATMDAEGGAAAEGLPSWDEGGGPTPPSTISNYLTISRGFKKNIIKI